MKKMNIFIDIDQTISTGYVGANVQESLAYYRTRGVAIPAGITQYIELFQVPEVVRIHKVFPGAQEGLRQLARLGEVSYATARASAVEEITRAWLREQRFPAPDQVLFCPGLAEKLLAIAAFPGPLVLIDDRWRQVIELIAEYGEIHRVLRSLRERLILVAFGATQADLPASAVVSVVPLAEWSSLTQLLTSEHFIHLQERIFPDDYSRKNR